MFLRAFSPSDKLSSLRRPPPPPSHHPLLFTSAKPSAQVPGLFLRPN
jgi:hypothetical protein